MAGKVTTEDRGAVRILTINRPDQRNCVDGETAVGIGRAIEAFAAETIASYPNFPGIRADRRARSPRVSSAPLDPQGHGLLGRLRSQRHRT